MNYLEGERGAGGQVLSGTWEGTPIKLTIGPVGSDFEPVPLKITTADGTMETFLPAIADGLGKLNRYNAVRYAVASMFTGRTVEELRDEASIAAQDA